jgi:hypothetical protein
MEDVYNTASAGKEMGEEGIEDVEEQLVPAFWEAVTGCKTVPDFISD